MREERIDNLAGSDQPCLPRRRNGKRGSSFGRGGSWVILRLYYMDKKFKKFQALFGTTSSYKVSLGGGESLMGCFGMGAGIMMFI